ncbi:MAG: shikimate dehydrogenase [Rhodospirillales bacterium]
MKVGIIGSPISHSLSQLLHGFWLKKFDIDGVYLPIAIEPNDFETKIRSLSQDGFAGFNVTVPHKETAYKLVDTLTETAREIGAVNTIICNENGRFAGDNTDAFGFISNIKTTVPSWKPDLSSAVVLGAGGAARAVFSALRAEGVAEIRICNRTRERAEELAAHFGNLNVVDWDKRNDACEGVGLLVNTTTLGMVGKPPLEINIDQLRDDAVVNDIVYAPLETDLLKSAKTNGYQPVDGLGMLLHQARPGFEAWFGQRPEVTDELREHVLAGLGHS